MSAYMGVTTPADAHIVQTILKSPPPWHTVGEMWAYKSKDPLWTRILSEPGGGHCTRIIYQTEVSNLYWETYIYYSMDEGPSESDRLTWRQVWPHPSVEYKLTPPVERTADPTKEIP